MSKDNLAYWKGRLINAQNEHGCFPKSQQAKEKHQMCMIMVEKLERIAFKQKGTV